MQVWHRARSLGISIPGDLKLAGFDGDEYGALVGLTTAEFDSERLAETAFDAILRARGTGDDARRRRDGASRLAHGRHQLASASIGRRALSGAGAPLHSARNFGEHTGRHDSGQCSLTRIGFLGLIQPVDLFRMDTAAEDCLPH